MALPTRPTSDPTWATSGANRASIDSAKRVEGFVGGGGADNGTVNTLWGVLGDWITFLGGVTPATGVIDCYTIRGVGVANSQPIDLQILDNGGGGILIEGTGATATTRLLATGGANDIGLTLTPSTGTALLDGDNVTIRGTRAGGEVVVRVSGGASNSDITFDRDTGDITMTGGAAVDFTSGTTLDMTATGDLTLDSGTTTTLRGALVSVFADTTALTLQGTTTVQITGGTGASVVATTGNLALTATAADVDVTSGGQVDVNAGTTVNLRPNDYVYYNNGGQHPGRTSVADGEPIHTSVLYYNITDSSTSASRTMTHAGKIIDVLVLVNSTDGTTLVPQVNRDDGSSALAVAMSCGSPAAGSTYRRGAADTVTVSELTYASTDAIIVAETGGSSSYDYDVYITVIGT